MNKTNKTIVALFLLCLIFLSITVPAIAIMTNEFFYQTALENADIMPKNDSQTTAIRYVKGMVSNTGYFTRGQFKEIIHHITQFLKGKKASFELFISNVIINGETREGVSIFGNQAISHMHDVKILFDFLKVITFILFAIFLVCLFVIIKRKNDIFEYIFSYSIKVISSVFSICILLVLLVLFKVIFSGYGLDMTRFAQELWIYMHYIFFPFDSNAYLGSFFNDALTYILTIDFFMYAVTVVCASLILSLTIWLLIARKLQKTK